MIKANIETKFSLEEKIKQLEEIEALFQRPDLALDSAIEKHKEAVLIAEEIVAYLKKAENELHKIDIQKLSKELTPEVSEE